MNYNPPLIVFSVEKATNTQEQNKRNIEFARMAIKEYTNDSVKEVKGRCKGVDETSFIVLEQYLPFVEKLCVDFGQESYLQIDVERNAFFTTPYGKPVYQGKFVPVSKEEANRSIGYTYDSLNNQYFIIK